MEVTFNLEASDKGAAFFALYAGLRMYKEAKDAQPKPSGAISIAAAEASCMLEDLKEQYPEQYEQAVAEYETVYSDPDSKGRSLMSQASIMNMATAYGISVSDEKIKAIQTELNRYGMSEHWQYDTVAEAYKQYRVKQVLSILNSRDKK